MVEIARQVESQHPFVPGQQRVLFINNFDSFVYNLVSYICTASEAKVKVVPNTISLAEVRAFAPDKIFISPGPGHPKHETANVIPIIQHLAPEVPIFGVCLGHQAICEAFGSDPGVEQVGRANAGPRHGKMSRVFHDGEGIFHGVPNPVTVVRYHSLAAKADILPKDLRITAMADDGTIMAVRHAVHETHGVQFHPESIMMRPHGMVMIANFLRIATVKR